MMPRDEGPPPPPHHHHQQHQMMDPMMMMMLNPTSQSSSSNTSPQSEEGKKQFMKQTVFMEWHDVCMLIGVQDRMNIEKWWLIIQQAYDGTGVYDHEQVKKNIKSDEETEIPKHDRFYHTTTHLYHLLIQFRDLCQQDRWMTISRSDSAVMRLAIFFHDIVYDVNRKDNEAQSAKLFAEAFVNDVKPKMLSEDEIKRVVMFIECTASHLSHKDKDDRILKYFLDFDLAVLALNTPKEDDQYFKDFFIEWKSKEEFLQSNYVKQYVESVRKEYSCFNDKEFASGRSAFLKKMLNTEHLYYTSALQARYEKQAFENMKWELTLYE